MRNYWNDIIKLTPGGPPELKKMVQKMRKAKVDFDHSAKGGTWQSFFEDTIDFLFDNPKLMLEQSVMAFRDPERFADSVLRLMAHTLSLCNASEEDLPGMAQRGDPLPPRRYHIPSGRSRNERFRSFLNQGLEILEIDPILTSSTPSPRKKPQAPTKTPSSGPRPDPATAAMSLTRGARAAPSTQSPDTATADMSLTPGARAAPSTQSPDTATADMSLTPGARATPPSRFRGLSPPQMESTKDIIKRMILNQPSPPRSEEKYRMSPDIATADMSLTPGARATPPSRPIGRSPPLTERSAQWVKDMQAFFDEQSPPRSSAPSTPGPDTATADMSFTRGAQAAPSTQSPDTATADMSFTRGARAAPSTRSPDTATADMSLTTGLPTLATPPTRSGPEKEVRPRKSARFEHKHARLKSRFPSVSGFDTTTPVARRPRLPASMTKGLPSKVRRDLSQELGGERPFAEMKYHAQTTPSGKKVRIPRDFAIKDFLNMPFDKIITMILSLKPDLLASLVWAWMGLREGSAGSYEAAFKISPKRAFVEAILGILFPSLFDEDGNLNPGEIFKAQELLEQMHENKNRAPEAWKGLLAWGIDKWNKSALVRQVSDLLFHWKSKNVRGSREQIASPDRPSPVSEISSSAYASGTKRLSAPGLRAPARGFITGSGTGDTSMTPIPQIGTSRADRKTREESKHIRAPPEEDFYSEAISPSGMIYGNRILNRLIATNPVWWSRLSKKEQAQMIVYVHSIRAVTVGAEEGRVPDRRTIQDYLAAKSKADPIIEKGNGTAMRPDGWDDAVTWDSRATAPVENEIDKYKGRYLNSDKVERDYWDIVEEVRMRRKPGGGGGFERYDATYKRASAESKSRGAEVSGADETSTVEITPRASPEDEMKTTSSTRRVFPVGGGEEQAPDAPDAPGQSSRRIPVGGGEEQAPDAPDAPGQPPAPPPPGDRNVTEIAPYMPIRPVRPPDVSPAVTQQFQGAEEEQLEMDHNEDISPLMANPSKEGLGIVAKKPDHTQKRDALFWESLQFQPNLEEGQEPDNEITNSNDKSEKQEKITWSQQRKQDNYIPSYQIYRNVNTAQLGQGRVMASEFKTRKDSQHLKADVELALKLYDRFLQQSKPEFDKTLGFRVTQHRGFGNWGQQAYSKYQNNTRAKYRRSNVGSLAVLGPRPHDMIANGEPFNASWADDDRLLVSNTAAVEPAPLSELNLNSLYSLAPERPIDGPTTNFGALINDNQYVHEDDYIQKKGAKRKWIRMYT